MKHKYVLEIIWKDENRPALYLANLLVDTTSKTPVQMSTTLFVSEAHEFNNFKIATCFTKAIKGLWHEDIKEIRKIKIVSTL